MDKLTKEELIDYFIRLNTLKDALQNFYERALLARDNGEISDDYLMEVISRVRNDLVLILTKTNEVTDMLYTKFGMFVM